jgi:bifunctional non-homologous end joining protein LigD
MQFSQTAGKSNSGWRGGSNLRMMGLTKYRAKRNFDLTAEPRGRLKNGKRSELSFVIQKHQASHLHYDLRLEWKGVLLSWAIPKGPSLDPSVKRLAMQVEDHPVEYGGFEGIIPEGEYGGGTVMVWDHGTWDSEGADVDAALKAGQLKFELHGSKLKGSWVLVRTKPFGKSSRNGWLLIKHNDRYASSDDITVAKPRSAVSKRLMAKIASDSGGNIEKAANADPEGSK